MRNVILWSAVVAMAATGVLSIVSSARADEPEYTIKQVMVQAHKNKLLNKILGGTATEDDKKKLVTLYVALSQNTPKKGSADSWKQKTGAIVTAVKAGDTAALRKATNCKECHSVHR